MVIQCDKKQRSLSIKISFIEILRVVYVIIAERKVCSHDNRAEYIGVVGCRCSTKMLLNIWQYSQENASAVVSFLINLKIASSLQLHEENPAHVVSCEVYKIFGEQLFYRTALNDFFWICQYISCHKASISELIIGKNYREVGRGGRSKLFLHTHMKYRRCTLVKGLY